MPYISIAVIVIFVYIVFFKSKKGNSILPKSSKESYQTIDDKFNAERKEKQQRIDRILEKINDKGVASLTPQEKALLDEYSNTN
ncbi:MAG: DUF6576 domain-containing protein [Kordia sp.]|uniref:DUF6576 domain-containing protein n=1 Tax=Kordia sp. TaxID=1965332 RepID=UPI00385A3B52